VVGNRQVLDHAHVVNGKGTTAVRGFPSK